MRSIACRLPPCNPRDRQAYWAEVQFGRNVEHNDMRLGYTLVRIERDAVIAAFNASDLRQATNAVTHRLCKLLTRSAATRTWDGPAMLENLCPALSQSAS
jgi:hypothetical protein